MEIKIYKGRTSVSYEEFQVFMDWYKASRKLRKLKFKDNVICRYLIDKTSQDKVVTVLSTRNTGVLYLIYDKFYKEFNDGLNK